MASENMQEADERWFRGVDEEDDYDDDREDGDCHWCAGEGWSECSDPIECTRQHRTYTSPAGVFYQECRCESCGGSGRAEDMTIW